MKKCICLLVLILALGAQVLADQITLKNGDRLTGKIVKSDGGKLFIKTELLGEVAVDLAAVTAITTDQPLYVTLADGRTLSGEFSASGDKAELRTDGGQYRINFDSALVTDITRRIDWQLTLSDRYLSDPPPGFEKNDLLLTTGLKIKLGATK